MEIDRTELKGMLNGLRDELKQHVDTQMGKQLKEYQNFIGVLSGDFSRRFKAKRWQDYAGIGEGIVEGHLRDRKREKADEDIYP